MQPAATGYADIAHTREIFSRLGLDLSDEDVKVLISTADADHDGAISLADFRGMLQRAAPKGEELGEKGREERLDASGRGD